VGSRNGTEETKLLVLDFDTDVVKSETVVKVDKSTEIQLDYVMWETQNSKVAEV